MSEVKITATSSKGTKYDVIIRDGNCYIAVNGTEYYGSTTTDKGKLVMSLYNAYKALGLPKQYERAVIVLDSDPEPIKNKQIIAIKKEKRELKVKTANERGIRFAIRIDTDLDRSSNPTLVKIYPATVEEIEEINYLPEYKRNYHHMLDELGSIDDEIVKDYTNGCVDATDGSHVYYFISAEQVDEIIQKRKDKNNADAIKEKAIKEAKEQKKQAIFDCAKDTNTAQVLATYTDECDGSVEECSIDTITIYTMSDGSTETVRSHCY